MPGKIVEQADRQQFFHPTPHIHIAASCSNHYHRNKNRRAELSVIRGFVPELQQQFSGCRFAPRCDYAVDDCSNTPATMAGIIR